MPRPQDVQPDTSVSQQSGLGYLVRFIWMLIAPAITIISLMVIFHNRPGGLSTADAVMWCAVAAGIVLRYIDVSRLKGLKATGEPASLADWRRYSVIVLVVALALWGFARSASILAVLTS